MFFVKTFVKDSSIEGLGVFAAEDIARGTIVWKFDPQHDLSVSLSEFQKLDKDAQIEIRRVGYVSPTSHRWIYPPENDTARFTNHSESSNNLSVDLDNHKSEEPIFVANRDIKKGEELTNNYIEFDNSIRAGRPAWM